MRNYFLGTVDRLRALINVGALVRVDRYGRAYSWHPEFRRAYRRIAGNVMTVVGRDALGSVQIALGAEGVLTVDPRLLKVVGRGEDRVAAFTRRNWSRLR